MGQNRRDFLKQASRGTLAAGVLAATGSGCSTISETMHPNFNASDIRKPNFIVLFADDMGYGDWSRGGNPTIRTPHLDRMATEGVQMTQFYSGNPVCSPSRSALLTGRNCIRTGVIEVFFPGNGRGMSTDEITIADALKPLGYQTACIGKWHLGSTFDYRPLRQGFDYYYGILYSNDMYRPDIWRDDERIESPSDQTTLTKRYTEEAIGFIEQAGDDPFFVYLPYTMPHIPLFASEDFLDSSRRGLYGDVIEEIDWSVGQILNTLRERGLDRNTFVLFTSDNGPWATENQHGGTAGQLRGAKGDTWEGGMREPAIAWWPGTLPEGSICMDVGSVIDLFPTLVGLAGGTLPGDRPYDGIDLMPTLQGAEAPERTICFFRGRHLRAIRKGTWKAHFSYFDHPKNGYFFGGNHWVTPDVPLLFDLETDPSERFDIAEDHPDIVADLTAEAEAYMADVDARAENKDLLDWFVTEYPFAPRMGD